MFEASKANCALKRSDAIFKKAELVSFSSLFYDALVLLLQKSLKDKNKVPH